MNAPTPECSPSRPSERSGDYFLDLGLIDVGDAVVRVEDEPGGHGWLWFHEPVEVLTATSLDEVGALVERASRFSESGWAVGFLSYEAGLAFDSAVHAQASDGSVLAWFACYGSPPIRHRELLPSAGAVDVALEEPELSFDAYKARFDRVKEALEAGACYQANLTFRQRFQLSGTAEAFFTSRCGVRPPPFATFIHGGDWRVASFSPELLLERVGDEVTMRPMKGTAACPAGREESVAAAKRMREDPKTIAENVMIVDMVRNDLGAVAEVGTVATPKLLDVERHRGLLQATSTVTARSSVPTPTLLASVFPPASVTGAPKVAATKLIAELESSPRGPYCGAVALLSPNRQRFSVAIRTAFIDVQTGNGEFGVGSGIVWNSDGAEEYEECLAKRDFLLNPGTSWALVEAFSSEYLDDHDRLGRHLERLGRSAKELGVPVDLGTIRRRLAEIPKPTAPMKVRIAASADGSATVAVEPSALPIGPIRATVARTPVDSADPNLRHKTNSRAVFEAHLEANPGFDEVLLHNERGDLTEFCRGNVLLRINSVLYTPEPSSGGLNGVHVSRLVSEGLATYSNLKTSDLARAEAVYLANSVVGMRQVDLR